MKISTIFSFWLDKIKKKYKIFQIDKGLFQIYGAEEKKMCVLLNVTLKVTSHTRGWSGGVTDVTPWPPQKTFTNAAR